MEKFRSRKFALLLYNEDPVHVRAIEYIKLNYDYAMINHDRDVDTDGVIKKCHTHIGVSFNNAKWNSAIAEELGITLNYIQKIRSFDNALEYLIHYNDLDKFQYSIEDVQGNLKNKLKNILLNEDKGESVKVSELISYINSYNGIITITDFASYCSSIDRWDVFRRSGSIFCRIIDEHNNYIYQQKKG